MRILFFGTPLVAVPYLRWLIENETVVGCVCQPDKPSGRGQDVAMPAVKAEALKAGLPVFQPSGPWTAETKTALEALRADVGVVVAYGRLLPQDIYKLPVHGSVNVHFSILPRYRGAAPVQWAILNGDTETGVSLFWLDDGMDSGPLAVQSTIKIDPADDAVSLREKLQHAGLSAMQTFFEQGRAGSFSSTPQAGAPSFAPLIKKETGRIDWTQSAVAIVAQVRALVEWPSAHTQVLDENGHPKLIKIFKAQVANSVKSGTPGTLLSADPDEGLCVQAGVGVVAITELQMEGKKRLPAWTFWQGARLRLDDVWGE